MKKEILDMQEYQAPETAVVELECSSSIADMSGDGEDQPYVPNSAPIR